MAENFDALGVCFGLGEATAGIIEVANKPSRADDIDDLIQDIKKVWFITGHQAEQARGRIGFSKAQVFRKAGAPALSVLASLVRRGGDKVSHPTISCLKYWAKKCRKARPRQARVEDGLPPIVLCTDGAEENEQVSIGGVLYDPLADGIEYFGEVVPDRIRKTWVETAGTTRTIHQGELLPIAVALDLWGDRLQNRSVFIYTDNEAAKFAVVSGRTANDAAAEILEKIWDSMVDNRVYPWVERVPTESNPADDPSRIEFRQLEEKGARRRRIDFACW